MSDELKVRRLTPTEFPAEHLDAVFGGPPHAKDCVPHSECSCEKAAFKARVTELLRGIEFSAQIGATMIEVCPACRFRPHAADCALAALLKECGS